MSATTIPPRSLFELLRSGSPGELIDVRTPPEFGEVHAEGARLVPLDSLDPQALLKPRAERPEQPLYLICKSGQRAAKAAEKLTAAGHTNIVCVEGGTQAWIDAGLPVVRGKKAISLERQVRIVAGMLIVASVLLGYFVHPYLFGLAGLIGAGLAFAGITDTCGMGMVLAKMPWNR